jgi:hypothetical protein
MMENNERSAYPHPDEFKVMRPEYLEQEDGSVQATILIAPFKVVGRSVSEPGARRAAIYEACKVYKSYHPQYVPESPFPEAFTDTENTTWKRLNAMQRSMGDYAFVDADGEEDYADIETMLMWDVRPS